VHIEEEFDYQYNADDLSMVELAREFDELESFAEKFGGERFYENPRFADVINEIEFALKDKDADDVNDNLNELKFSLRDIFQ